MKFSKFLYLFLLATLFLTACGEFDNNSKAKKKNSKTEVDNKKDNKTTTSTSADDNTNENTDANNTATSNEANSAKPNDAQNKDSKTENQKGKIAPDQLAAKSTWADNILLQIEQALDQNPVAILQNLPTIQNEILTRAGFVLSCDEGWGGFKKYEMKECYTAIKALLIAIKKGLAPLSPIDGITIEEIKIVKGASRLYEPIYNRHGLEVNYLITATEWPALLKSEIDGYARTRRVYRNDQVNSKTALIMGQLAVAELVADVNVELVDFEKGVHSLEQAITLKEQMLKKSGSTTSSDVLSDKSYEGIRIAKKAKDLYEDDGRFYVNVSYKSAPLEMLKHLVRQPNKDGKDLNSEQLKLLGLNSNNKEYRSRAVAALQNTLMRSKITRLQNDIQYHMLEGKVTIEINLDRTVNCSYFVFCSAAGVTIAEAYKFLMDLREAISGGHDLSQMKVKKIELRNKVLYEGIISNNNQHILFGTNAVPTSIYSSIWYTTPAGIQFLKEIAEIPNYSHVY